ncbi:pyridoxamine 5'-phosphate oxidase family protein [bacterium]|nr:pyridoxamine 5'-phosphate oxidase family protein [bacterium]
MTSLPEMITKAWENREGPAIFTTVDRNGNPNSIYVTCVFLHGDDRIAIADNYFNKTRENIRAGSRGSLLFITKEKKAYQMKGMIEYQESGEIREFLKDCLDPKYPVHAAAVLLIDEVYSGAEKIV